MLPTTLLSQNVIWDGPNIPCLNLCTKSAVSNVLYDLGKEVCHLIDQETELEKLKLNCLIDYCQNCNKDYSLKHIFELMLKNDCNLNELLTNIQNIITEKSQIHFDLNFGCLNNLCEIPLPYDNCGTLTTQDYNIIFQFFIDKICCQQEIIDYEFGAYMSSYNTYDEIKNEFQSYIEPTFKICLSEIELKHSNNTELIGQTVCTLNSNVGNSLESLVDVVPPTTIFGTPIPTLTNIAQSTQYQWMIIEELGYIVEMFEYRPCCQPKCSDIKLNPYISFDKNQNVISLNFFKYYNNYIPANWINNSFYISITDNAGHNITNYYDIKVDTIIDIDISTLDLYNPLTIELHTDFTNTKKNLNCKKTIPYIITVDALPLTQSSTLTIPQVDVLDVWVINHNLGYHPSVVTFDTSNVEIIGTIDHINNNLLTITFGSAYAGTAYLT